MKGQSRHVIQNTGWTSSGGHGGPGSSSRRQVG